MLAIICVDFLSLSLLLSVDKTNVAIATFVPVMDPGTHLLFVFASVFLVMDYYLVLVFILL